jgi:hypothetical protein
MYTNKGLSIICGRFESQCKDIYKRELMKFLCLYAGKQELDEELDKSIKETLIKATKLFLDESLVSNQSIISLFGEWLGNGAFRKKCLHNKKLIEKGSAILEVFPYECVEVPVLQLLYNNVNWVSDIPEDVLILSKQAAKRNVSRTLNSIYENS